MLTRACVALVAALSLTGCASVRCLLMDHPHRSDPAVAAGFVERSMSRADGTAMPYYTIGKGPGVLLLHELPGMTPQFLDLASHLAESGFTVYAPLLFGRFGERLSHHGETGVCFRHDITCFSKTGVSPVAEDLAPLVQRIHAETSGGVGVIGMCLTGNVPIALAADPVVRAIVLSQPAMPMVIPWPGYKRAIGVSQVQVDAAKGNRGLRIIAQRFASDCVSPPERLDALKAAFGAQIETVTLTDPVHGAHAILTDNMDFREGTETRAAYDRIVTLFHQTLSIHE